MSKMGIAGPSPWVARIGAAFGCEPDDEDDLFEAVKALVRERDEARDERDALSDRIDHLDQRHEEDEAYRQATLAERDEALDKLRVCEDVPALVAELRAARVLLAQALDFAERDVTSAGSPVDAGTSAT